MPRNRKRLRSSSSSLSSSSSAAIVRKIEDLEETMRNSFARLTEEIITLRREVNRKRGTEAVRRETVLPAAAVSSQENLDDLEENIKQAEAFENLVMLIFSAPIKIKIKIIISYIETGA